jgi:hypothetical protein
MVIDNRFPVLALITPGNALSRPRFFVEGLLSFTAPLLR